MVGHLYTDPSGNKEIRVTAIDGCDPYYSRHEAGMPIDEREYPAVFKEIYDERQGSYVSGIVLCSYDGIELPGEHYKLSDFNWSGNLPTDNYELIRF